jgi:hypothetical protein
MTDGLTFLVWPLVVALAGAAVVTIHQPPSTKDLSTHSHRQLIGYVGLSLPVVLPIINSLRNTQGLANSDLDSISSYYYTGAVALFVGALVALAAFLFTYRGYNNKYSVFDRIAGFIAGGAAIGVAFFPTRAPNPSLKPSWWIDLTGQIHFGSAIVLFLTLACFALLLFPMTDPDEPRPSKDNPLPGDKRWRNWFYRSCGVVMVACILWAWIALRNNKGIFWPEAIALIAFAASWLVKGRFEWTLLSAVKSTWRYTRDPGQVLAKVRSYKAS